MKLNNWGRVKFYPHTPANRFLGEDFTISFCYSKLSQLFLFERNLRALFRFFEVVSEKRALLLQDKPGTTIDKIDDLSSNRGLFGQSLPTASSFAIVDANNFDYSGKRTVPVVNLVQICEIKVSGVRQLSA